MDAAPAARVSGTERPMSFQIHGPRTAFPNLAGIGRTWDVFLLRQGAKITHCHCYYANITDI